MIVTVVTKLLNLYMRRLSLDAFETVSAKWVQLCERHGVDPETVLDPDVPIPSPGLSYDRERLVYGACAIWPDPMIINILAYNLPHIFRNWKPSTI